jgi:mono/diheme cytochrome c family protein
MKRAAAILLLLLPAPGALAQGSAAAAAPDDTVLLGLRLFNQSCRVCHTRPQLASPLYGPALSRDSLGGQDEALRAFIAKGSPRMPGFRSHFRPEEIAAIAAYLRTIAPAAVVWPESD